MKKKKGLLQKIMAWTLALLMVLTMSGVSELTTMQVQASGTTPVLTKPAEGDGGADTPYEIGTPGELFWFAALVNGTLSDGTPKNAAA